MSKCKKWSEVLEDDGVIERKCAEGEFGDCVACEIMDWAEELSLASLRLAEKAKEIHATDGYQLTVYEAGEFEKTREIIEWPLNLVRLLGRSRAVSDCDGLRLPFEIREPLPRDEMRQRVSELIEKYESLVWLARAGMLSAGASADRIRKEYPEEVEQYLSSKNGDWEHGFNSGALAAFRLADAILEADPRCRKKGEEDFPDLDTCPAACLGE